MQGDRLIAYSDGVIAIIVTIMVLELHAPSTPQLASLLHLWPTFGAYALSFLLVSIYWVNHHHLLFANRRIDRDVLWLNIHFLFWLSLFPFATAYVSATRGAPIAVAIYAALGVATAAAFRFLGVALSRRNAHVTVVAQVAPGRRRKKHAGAARQPRRIACGLRVHPARLRPPRHSRGALLPPRRSRRGSCLEPNV